MGLSQKGNRHFAGPKCSPPDAGVAKNQAAGAFPGLGSFILEQLVGIGALLAEIDGPGR